ncbi:hypothetical protein DAPPUDRAFT_260993 [Daphnia pulex]|uniref:Chitin-binding type-1 domain-containing protein n=1 Tax=Daphnia pulex TaxID=6669 RepID=E9HKB6_DAPPU|nr:hypothetical protein DAPPUDRAFT_260993 [Daphnia pulex]|eukprot:EFX67861.1 hypothetical protein DAPPUDRAFT_260993 [Daphnia pulex]
MLLSERFVVLTIFGAHLLGSIPLCECQRCGSDQPKCPNNLCCSTYGYCGATGEHCCSGCQPQYGHCHPSSVNASTEATNENVVYKSMETLSEIVDGNLLTCRLFPKEIVQKIPIESTHSKIQDIRITTHKIVDIDKTLNNETTHWEKTFNDTIEYGKAVIFLSNLTINVISGSKRFIRLKPLVDLNICEVEVSSFPSGQDESYIKWVAIATSSVIFFLLVILILVVVCFQNHFKNKNSAIDKEHHSNSKNEYSLTDHQRAPRPPGLGFSNPGHSSFNGSEDHADYYEEINYPFVSPLPQLNSNSASDLLGQGVYDEAISLGKVLNKPRFAPPSVPQFPTNY